jgi:recombination protein RecA
MAHKPAKTAAEAAAEVTVTRIRKLFGPSAAILPGMETPRSQVRGVIPSLVDVVDRFVMGIGGLPLGRLTELYSEPGIAKTSFAWTAISGCIKAGGLAVYCDSEQSYDKERVQAFGVDPAAIVLLQPLTLEEALGQMEATLVDLEFDGPVLLVWDSLAEAPYKGDLTGDYGKESADNRAKLIGRFCRVTSTLAVQRQAAILIINQARQRRGLIFGDKTTTPGGAALKFYASLRIQLFGGKAIKDQHGLHIGKAVTFIAMKTRFSQPFRKAKVRLDFQRGWDNLWSTINHAKDMALVPAGAKYSPATYALAVEALGWKDAAPAVELASTAGVVDESEETDEE